MASTQSNSKGVAVVTGSGQGIGRNIALRLAEDGYDIAINDLESNKENLDAVRKEIIASFPERKVLVIFADVAIEEKVKGLVESVVKEFGKLNVFVANAGIIKAKTLLETTSDDFTSVLSVNVTGVFYCYKYAAQQMIAQGDGGRIIGASSLAGKRGNAYCASKFAVRGLTQSAAVELGRHGITVNAYAPGAIETLMREFRHDPLILYIEHSGDLYKQMKEESAVGHLGSTKDVANLVSFLVTPEARFVTGMS
ncbi:NAD(P)-binding protein, partial [Rhizopogon salebrosus TDB-379]